MSIEAMSWALEQPVSGTKKVVLIGISSHADKFGGNAWPSVSTLAGYAYVSNRAVQQAIAELETDGYLFREFNEGGSKKLPDHLRPNLYTLHLEAKPVPQKKGRSQLHPLQPDAPVQPASPLVPGAASFTPSPAASFTPPGEAGFTQTFPIEPSFESSLIPEAPAGPPAVAEPVITEVVEVPMPEDKSDAIEVAPSPAAPPEKPLSAFRLKLAADKAAREEAKAKKALQAAADREARKAAQADLRKATWTAFDAAYQARYGTTLTRNMTTNSLMVSFVERLGGEAPEVAAFYVRRVTEQFVVSKCHPLNLLLNGAESYRTQWATGKTAAGPQAAPHKYAGAAAAIWGNDNDDARTINA